eukprot:4481504-Pyramimonas_sp.AAC.1
MPPTADGSFGSRAGHAVAVARATRAAWAFSFGRRAVPRHLWSYIEDEEDDAADDDADDEEEEDDQEEEHEEEEQQQQ